MSLLIEVLNWVFQCVSEKQKIISFCQQYLKQDSTLMVELKKQYS